jgi:glycosyltransferase involved in cell wall biosynthesis
MIKIAFYSHEIDFAGTWRSHERIIEELQNYDDFKTYVLYSPDVNNNRLDICRKILNKTEFIPFNRSKEKTGPNEGWIPIETNFSEVCSKLDLDILHFARSGYFEWPLNDRNAKLQIETNIFGYDDYTPYLDKSIAIGNTIQNIKKKKSDIVIPNPIPSASNKYDTLSDMREEFGFLKDDIILGRIGRAANFNPIALSGFSIAKSKFSNLKYLIVSPCSDTINFVNYNNIKDVFYIDPTNDDDVIERFHKTIDIFAHYRLDGEIHSTAIAQAMIYGIPVISHYAGLNGQVETIGTGGFCVSNSDEYADAIIKLIDTDERFKIGDLGKIFTKDRSEQKKIGLLLATKYREWLNC